MPTYRNNNTKHRSQEGDNYRLSVQSIANKHHNTTIANRKNNRSFVFVDEDETVDRCMLKCAGVIMSAVSVWIGVFFFSKNEEKNARAPN